MATSIPGTAVIASTLPIDSAHSIWAIRRVSSLTGPEIIGGLLELLVLLGPEERYGRAPDPLGGYFPKRDKILRLFHRVEMGHPDSFGAHIQRLGDIGVVQAGIRTTPLISVFLAY